ncbi:hypothetical protein MMC20_000598 [Loxospora ochrophaea]|nr:hypothetical protein [Loxospora ochrophaea]
MDGYPRLARLIGQKPEVAIFRRFGTLNAENLLFLQAELLTLERELRDIVTDDLTSDDEQRKSYSSSWWALKESSESKTADQAQWQKRKEMREKLKEYNSALLQATRLHALSPPSKGDLSLLRTWMMHPKGGANFLDGDEDGIWDEANQDDLVCLATSRGEQDPFTRWVTGPFLNFVHNHLLYRYPRLTRESFAGKTTSRWRLWDAGTGITDYQDETLLVSADNISTLVASLLPVLSTIVLYFIPSTPVRLGAIVAFIALFAVVLIVFTKAKRIEVFSVTAA